MNDQRAAMMLGLRSLAREWRSGDLAVLFLALFVAVAALTGVGFLVDRIDRAMQLQASEVLGADLRLYSPDAIGDRYEAEAAHFVALQVELLVEASTPRRADHPLDRGEPERGEGGKLFRQRVHLLI